MKLTCQNPLYSSGFDTILACEGQTDRQTVGQTHDDSKYSWVHISRAPSMERELYLYNLIFEVFWSQFSFRTVD